MPKQNYLILFAETSGISSRTSAEALPKTNFVKSQKHCAASLWYLFCHAQQQLQLNPKNAEMLQLANRLAHDQFDLGSATGGADMRLGTAYYLQQLRSRHLSSGEWVQAAPAKRPPTIRQNTYKHRFKIIATSLRLWETYLTPIWSAWTGQTEITEFSIIDAAIAWGALRFAEATFNDPIDKEKGQVRQVLLTRISGDTSTPRQLFDFMQDLRTWRDTVRHPQGQTLETVFQQLRCLIVRALAQQILPRFSDYKRRFLRYREALQHLLDSPAQAFIASPNSPGVDSEPSSPATPRTGLTLLPELRTQLADMQRFLSQFRAWKQIGDLVNIAPSFLDKLLGPMAVRALPGLSQDSLDWMKTILVETFVLPNTEAAIGEAYTHYDNLQKSGWFESMKSFYIFTITAQLLSTPNPDEQALQFLNHYTQFLMLDGHPLTKIIYNQQPWLMLCYQQAKLNDNTLFQTLNYLHRHHSTSWTGELHLSRTLQSLAAHISECSANLEQDAIKLYQTIYRFIEENGIMLANNVDHPFWYVRQLQISTTIVPHKIQALKQLEPSILRHLRSTLTSTDLTAIKSIPMHPTRYILFHYEYNTAYRFFFERHSPVNPEILLTILALGMELAMLVTRDAGQKVIHKHNKFTSVDTRLTKQALARIKGQRSPDGQLYLSTDTMQQHLLARIISTYKTSKVLRIDEQASIENEQHKADYQEQITMAFIQFSALLEQNPSDTVIYEIMHHAIGYALWDLFYLMTNKLWENDKKSWPELFVKTKNSKYSRATPVIKPLIRREIQRQLNLPAEFQTMTRVLTQLIYLQRAEDRIEALNKEIAAQLTTTKPKKTGKKQRRSGKKKKNPKTPVEQLTTAKEGLKPIHEAISQQHGMLKLVNSAALPLGAGPLVIKAWTQFADSRQFAVAIQGELEAQVVATTAQKTEQHPAAVCFATDNAGMNKPPVVPMVYARRGVYGIGDDNSLSGCAGGGGGGGGKNTPPDVTANADNSARFTMAANTGYVTGKLGPNDHAAVAPYVVTAKIVKDRKKQPIFDCSS